MTGPEHFKAAEQLLASVQGDALDGAVAKRGHGAVAAALPHIIAQAQVHASLALAAATAAAQATAYDGDELGERSRGWAGVA